MRDFRVQIFK